MTTPQTRKAKKPKKPKAQALSRLAAPSVPDKPWDGMSLGNAAAQALALKIGSPPTDSDREFHRKAQRHMATVAGLSSTLLAVGLTNQAYSLSNAKPDDQSQEVAAHLAIDLFEESQPRNLNEAQLDVLMFGVQNAAAEFLKRSLIRENTPEIVDRNVNRAVRLLRVFNEQLEAKAKLKGTAGQQRVVVEHVTVQPGGKAIVGAVTASLQAGGLTGGES